MEALQEMDVACELFVVLAVDEGASREARQKAHGF